MTTDEVEDALLSHKDESDGYADTFSWYDWSEFTWHGKDGPTVTTVEGLGDVTLMDTYTGGEGGGEAAELVFRIAFEDGTVRHFRIAGYYASHDGTHWDGEFTEVEPQEKTITVYV